MFESLRKIYQEFGYLAGSIYCIDRLMRRISNHLRLYYYELMMQPVRPTPLLPKSLSRAFEFREIVAGQSEIDLMPARPEVLALRFRQNARCLGLFKGDELAGYVWLGFGQYEEDEVRCNFELSPRDRSSFDFDLYIFPKYRMGPAFAALWDGANSFLRELGVDQTFSRMTRFNTPSRRAHQRLGSIRIGQIIFVHFWGIEVSISTVPNCVHVSLQPSSRVKIELKTLVQNATQ